MNTDCNITVCYIQLFNIGFSFYLLYFLHIYINVPNILIAQRGFTDFTVKYDKMCITSIVFLKTTCVYVP